MEEREWIKSLFPKPGYFVEAGAHDGVGDSHTYALEQEGWTGICVEPSSAFDGLKASRTCKVDNRCLWSHDGRTVPFWQVDGEGVELSGIQTCFCDKWDRSKGTLIDKPTVTLTTLLREHGAPPVIELLCLDTEGSEYKILRTHDFEAYQFLAIIVEHNNVIRHRNMIETLLLDEGYRLDKRTEVEDWYIHKEGMLLYGLGI